MGLSVANKPNYCFSRPFSNETTILYKRMFFQKVKPPLGMLGGDGMITFGADGEQVVLTDYGGAPVRS